MGSAQDQAKIWSVGAKEWATKFEPHFEPLWHVMLAKGGVTRGKKFFDAGCGSGGASVLAKRRGADVTGLDATPELIDIAKERLPQSRFDVGDLEALPYDDQSFDVVFAANAVQFTYEPANTLREIRRVLAPHGRAVVAVFTEMDRNGMGHVFKEMYALIPERPKVGPFALGKPGLLEGAIEAAGLTVARDVEVPCDFVYSDIEDMWQTLRPAGPVQNLIGKVGEAAVHEAALRGAKPFVRPGGEVHLVNYSHVVTLQN